MSMKTRFVSLIVISLIVALALPQLGQAPIARAAGMDAAAAVASSPFATALEVAALSPVDLSAPSEPRACSHLGDVIVASPPAITLTPRAHLPLFQNSPFSCYTGQTYTTQYFHPSGSDGDAVNSYDKNLDMRGYTLDATGSLGYTFLDGTGVSTAPRLWSLFSPAPAAPFAHIFNVGKAPWDPGPAWMPDRLLGIATTVGTQIRLPISPGAVEVAQPGGPGTTKYYGLVLYATNSQITIVYHSWDRIVNADLLGYGLHVTHFCVDPGLVNLYNQLNSAGRYYLPALTLNQAFGVANSNEVYVAITDSGTFMDPRAYKDWWRP